jgi:hypothetical protein
MSNGARSRAGNSANAVLVAVACCCTSAPMGSPALTWRRVANPASIRSITTAALDGAGPAA